MNYSNFIIILISTLVIIYIYHLYLNNYLFNYSIDKSINQLNTFNIPNKNSISSLISNPIQTITTTKILDKVINEKIELEDCEEDIQNNKINEKSLIQGISTIDIDNCEDIEYNKIKTNIHPDILKNYMNENFDNITKNLNNKNFVYGLTPIKANKLYYGLDCNYIKDDTFYTALKQEGFILTTNIKEACLIVPCSYETTEKEIIDLEEKGINNNIYHHNVRIFMLNNTDFMVSKIALWKFLKDRYGLYIASSMTPYSVDINNKQEYDDFKKNYNKNKIYITKNNNQRQEGIEIHTSIESIEKTKDKYILIQELLQNPYLIKGKKINLRVYCLIIKDSNENMKVQIYQDGFMYYTPELFEKGNPSFKKNITTGYIDRNVYIDNPLTHEDFKKYLDDPTRKLSDIEEYIKNSIPSKKLSIYVFGQINHLIKFIIETYKDIIGSKTFGVGFQLYGIDIAIDNVLKPMIMEINKGPDLTGKDKRDRELKIQLSKDILKSTGLIQPNINNKFLTIFEVVKINNDLINIDNYSNLFV